MGKLRKEINELKEKYDARFEAFSKKYEEQNQMILNKLITIGDRVRKLENPEPGNGQVTFMYMLLEKLNSKHIFLNNNRHIKVNSKR